MRHFDISRLTRFFGSDRVFYSSPMGAMQRFLLLRSADSAGQRIPRTPPWSFLPQPDRHLGTPGLRGIMYVNETPSHTAGSYEIDDSKMADLGEIDRQLRTVCRLSPLSYRVLAAYHGDRGSQWAAAAIDRIVEIDGKPKVFRGLGPGALVALYPLTEAGRALLTMERGLGRHEDEKNPSKRQAAELAAHTTYREELQAAIVEKQVDLAKLGEQGGALDRVAVVLGELRVRQAIHKQEGEKVPSALRTKITEAEKKLADVRTGQADLRRTIHHLQTQYAYTAAPPAAKNPILDNGTRETLRLRQEIQGTYDTELRVWLDTKEALERVCGPMADTDPRLGSKPLLPDLPPVPQASTAHLLRSEPTAELSDDAVLRVAFSLTTTNGQQKQGSRRTILLQRAAAQATMLLQQAWVCWGKAGQPAIPQHASAPRLPDHPPAPAGEPPPESGVAPTPTQKSSA